jgi:hypothetical protein
MSARAVPIKDAAQEVVVESLRALRQASQRNLEVIELVAAAQREVMASAEKVAQLAALVIGVSNAPTATLQKHDGQGVAGC